MKVYLATKTLEGYLPPLETTENPAEAEILLVGGKAIRLEEFPRLRCIFKTGVGTDNLPFTEAEARGIEVGLPSEATREIIYEETASFACHLILTALYLGQGDWQAWRKVDRPSLSGQRLLVLGTGRIGHRVAARMKGFLKVDTYDTAVNNPSELEGKMRSCDCVSLHVPLTEETRGLFDAEKLGWLQPGAAIVNTARGAVIEEAALLQELRAGRLRAALDVFSEEPYRGELTEVPSDRLVLTPHIASTCREFLEGTARDFTRFMEVTNR